MNIFSFKSGQILQSSSNNVSISLWRISWVLHNIWTLHPLATLLQYNSLVHYTTGLILYQSFVSCDNYTHSKSVVGSTTNDSSNCPPVSIPYKRHWRLSFHRPYSLVLSSLALNFLTFLLPTLTCSLS